MLVGEPAAGPPEAGLDLVEDEEQVALIAPLPHLSQVAGRRRDDSDLAHHRLEQHRDGLVRGGGLDGGGIVVRDVDEAVRQRPERVGVFVLPAGGDRRKRSAVKRPGGGDDLERATSVPGAPLARQLDRRLVGFGAGVAEEDARGKRQLDEPPRQLDLRLGEVQVRGVDQLGRLPRHGGHDVGMRMTEEVDRDSRDEVEVPAA